MISIDRNSMGRCCCEQRCCYCDDCCSRSIDCYCWTRRRSCCRCPTNASNGSRSFHAASHSDSNSSFVHWDSRCQDWTSPTNFFVRKVDQSSEAGRKEGLPVTVGIVIIVVVIVIVVIVGVAIIVVVVSPREPFEQLAALFVILEILHSSIYIEFRELTVGIQHGHRDRSQLTRIECTEVHAHQARREIVARMVIVVIIRPIVRAFSARLGLASRPVLVGIEHGILRNAHFEHSLGETILSADLQEDGMDASACFFENVYQRGRVLSVVIREERKGGAGLRVSTRTTDSMDVHRIRCGKIEIDHKSYVVDICAKHAYRMWTSTKKGMLT